MPTYPTTKRPCPTCGAEATSADPHVDDGWIVVPYTCTGGHAFEKRLPPPTDFERRAEYRRQQRAEAEVAASAMDPAEEARRAERRRRELEALAPKPAPAPAPAPLGEFAEVVKTPSGPELVPIDRLPPTPGVLQNILDDPEVKAALDLARRRGGVIAPQVKRRV